MTGLAGAGVCWGMQAPDAVVTAVLRTLVRATTDARVPVVLRSRRAGQAQRLAAWLTAAHGSRRIVIASTRTRAQIEVRLPVQMRWPERFDGPSADGQHSPPASPATTFAG